MTINEANEEMCRRRDVALSSFAMQMHDAGIGINDERFRREMLDLAAALEQWRHDALIRIGRRIGAIAEMPRGVTDERLH